MKLSVCTDALFRGVDTVEAMNRVKTAGYSAIEFWSWWDKDIDAIAREKERLGLKVVAFCTKMESPIDKQSAFLEGLEESIAVAKTLDCHQLITQSGADTGEPRAKQREKMLKCLSQAAPKLEKANITLLLEPLNEVRDHPGIFSVRSDDTVEILEALKSPNVKYLFDIYHQQISEGDVITNICRYLPYIGHFHCAGNPGRGELYNGELHYGNIFTAIGDTGYTGYMGLEYFPSDPVERGLQYALDQINNEPVLPNRGPYECGFTKSP